MENKSQDREQYIFVINNNKIDVLPLLNLISNEGEETIASAIDTLMFDYLSQGHDSEPQYLHNLISVLREVRDAFQRVGNGSELNFYVVKDKPEDVDKKLYWSILKD